METKKFLNYIFFFGLFLFHLFFWKENQGLNTVFFTVFSVAFLLYIDTSRWNSTFFKITSIGTLLLSFFVVWNNSDISIICFWLSWVLMIGTAIQSQLYYLLYALMQGIENVFASPNGILKNLKPSPKPAEDGFVPERTSGLRPSLFLIPIFILFIFIVLYMIGNQDFAHNIGIFIRKIFRNLDWIFDLFSFKWLIFIFLGFFIIGGLIYQNSSDRWSKAQLSHVFDIKIGNIIPNMSMINDRFWIAFLTLAMLNILILVVNIQDFFNIANTSNIDAGSMRYAVHFGTYALIFSIVIAMALLFYFFKDDLNFIEKAPQLRLLAYIWIIQNAVMVITVALKNGLYISHYGLAYKRIGVIFFLGLVIFGLFTMILKVKNQKTFNYLFHINTWAVYVMFIIISAINWDVFITEFNLKNTDKDKLDVDFLINNISDKNLKTLYLYKSYLPEKFKKEEYGWFSSSSAEYYTEQQLEAKKGRFLEEKSEKMSFFSWNYPDYSNRMYFK